jgi:release factor glutamine methyltransferase
MPTAIAGIRTEVRDVQDYRRSLARCTASQTRANRPSRVRLGDREWAVLDGVFSPADSPSSAIGLAFLGLGAMPVGPGDGASEASDVVTGDAPSGSFLEVGSGTGVIAVRAALAGCSVTAVDINPVAVRNTATNAALHGRSQQVRVLHSDLFSALGEQERFDTVFWSSNYVLAPGGFRYRSISERAYVDPGYAAHRRYLTEAPERVRPGGRALLHFSSRGNLAELCRIAEECGRSLTIRRFHPVREGEDLIDHMLLEITRQG